MEYFGLTDIGKVRSQNQDYFLCSSSGDGIWCFLIVCDGMGGAKAGNVASKLAADTFSEVFIKALDSNFSDNHIRNCLISALNSANTRVYKMSTTEYECHGMGTTLVAAFIYDHRCYVLNVGDSCAYLSKNTVFEKITHDHSYVQHLLDIGAISEEEARHHVNKNVITRAVGTSPEVLGDIFQTDLPEGTRLMLCSDGLINMAEPDEIHTFLVKGNTEESCRALVTLALDRGANDNITVVVYDA